MHFDPDAIPERIPLGFEPVYVIERRLFGVVPWRSRVSRHRFMREMVRANVVTVASNPHDVTVLLAAGVRFSDGKRLFYVEKA